MQVLPDFRSDSKGNGTAAPSRHHGPAAGVPLPVTQPKKRKSLFAREIWSAERKPSFARSSIYGYAR